MGSESARAGRLAGTFASLSTEEIIERRDACTRALWEHYRQWVGERRVTSEEFAACLASMSGALLGHHGQDFTREEFRGLMEGWTELLVDAASYHRHGICEGRPLTGGHEPVH